MVLLVKLKRPGFTSEPSASGSERAEQVPLASAAESSASTAENAQLQPHPQASGSSTTWTSKEKETEPDAGSQETHSGGDGVDEIATALSQSTLRDLAVPTATEQPQGSDASIGKRPLPNLSDIGNQNTMLDSATQGQSRSLEEGKVQRSSLQIAEENREHASLPLSKVSVYLAPAVLGHRYVRSRATDYIVERPERLNATLLAVAALLGRLQGACVPSSASTSSVKQEDDAAASLLALASRLESLTVQTAPRAEVFAPFEVILSRASASLATPSAAISAIHAYPEEALDASEVGKAPEFSPGSPVWPDATTSYASLLNILCTLAPSRPPSPDSQVRDFGSSTSTGFDHRSEIPETMSQGDLYLCGSSASPISASDMPKLATATGDALSGLDMPSSVQFPAVDTDVSLVAAPSTPPRQSSARLRTTPRGEDEWTERGSLGAIEASLGTCCAALDHVVHAAGGKLSADGLDRCETIDMNELGKAGTEGQSSSASSAVSVTASKRAFVLARPPGHHCTATKPSGFCWVNNVAVMAAHAYEKHGIDRIAILDFDLHHGDGTQSIAWRINAQTAASDADRAARLKAMHAGTAGKGRRDRRSATASSKDTPEIDASDRRGLQISYGSLHDIESFPCEDGDKTKVSDASVTIQGAHGQWIQNVHLESHDSRDTFLAFYKAKYSSLLSHARRFFNETEAEPSKSLVIISAGFDACIHEHPGMQRHGKSVPPEFYSLFTRDAVQVAEEFCQGKCISVLEGGYSDRALTSGVIAHLAGLADIDQAQSEHLCQLSTLTQLERMAKASSSNMISRSSDSSNVSPWTPQPGSTRRRAELSARDPDWLRFTLEALKRLQECCGKERLSSRDGAATMPATPMGMGHELRSRHLGEGPWRSPRETRSHRVAESAKASPLKMQPKWE